MEMLVQHAHCAALTTCMWFCTFSNRQLRRTRIDACCVCVDPVGLSRLVFRAKAIVERHGIPVIGLYQSEAGGYFYFSFIAFFFVQIQVCKQVNPA